MESKVGVVGSAGRVGGAGPVVVSAAQVAAAKKAMETPEMNLLIAAAQNLYPAARVKAENDPARHLELGYSVTAKAVIGSLEAATTPKAEDMRGAIKTLLRYQAQLDQKSRTQDLVGEEKEDFIGIQQLGFGLCMAIAFSATAVEAFMNDYAR